MDPEFTFNKQEKASGDATDADDNENERIDLMKLEAERSRQARNDIENNTMEPSTRKAIPPLQKPPLRRQSSVEFLARQHIPGAFSIFPKALHRALSSLSTPGSNGCDEVYRQESQSEQSFPATLAPTTECSTAHDLCVDINTLTPVVNAKVIKEDKAQEGDLALPGRTMTGTCMLVLVSIVIALSIFVTVHRNSNAGNSNDFSPMKSPDQISKLARIRNEGVLRCPFVSNGPGFDQTLVSHKLSTSYWRE